MDQLAHHRVSEARLNLVTQRLAFHLKRGHRNGLDSSRKLVLRNRLVAVIKAGNERKHDDEEDKTQGFGHRSCIVTRIVSAAAFTSWTRTMWAPFKTAAAIVAIVPCRRSDAGAGVRSEEHTSELQSQSNLVCRLLLEKKKKS